MVPGLNSFREWFKDYKDQYVLIGGAACDIYMESADAAFRATKDLDIVLIVEAVTAEFVSHFWEYVKAGGYEHMDRSRQKPEFYRFSKPSSRNYPAMLELFSRPPYNVSLEFPANIAPVHIEDASISLSAILLDDEYYNFLVAGRTSVDDISILDYRYIIPFKAKAWLDLSDKRAAGESIDGKDVKKHKNDVLRLANELTAGSTMALPIKIREDMQEFIERVNKERADMRSLGLRDRSFEKLMLLLKIHYDL